MRISIDERDITNFLELEQYFKERCYLINWQEFELISEIAKGLNPIDIQYRAIHEKDYFIVIYSYSNEPYDKFYCWSKVGKEREHAPRRRFVQKNVEEVNTLSSLYYYLMERSMLLNSREFALLAQTLSCWNVMASYQDCKVKSVNWVDIESEKKAIYIPSGIDAHNQVTARYYISFEQLGRTINLDTYIMHYNRFARERRRDHV